tara:strand:- start:125 stop:505 length:381 start_codon:yes stop_codon:yes gene_type:complete
MSIGFTLPLQRGDSGYFEVSHDLLTQIKSNFINLVSTMKGERFSNPTFGCDIHKALFNFNNDDLPNKARESVEEAVARWMPYIELEDFQINTIDADKDRQTARIYMSYRLTEQPNLSDDVLIQILI